MGNFESVPLARSTAAADFDADHHLDVAAASLSSNRISIMRGMGDGTLLEVINFPVSYGISDIAVGDFNNDNRPDLAVAVLGELGRRTNRVAILLNNPTQP